MAEPLHFIHPRLVERLENGTFVAERKKKSSPEASHDRRKLSPLSIIKRCVRYDPNVFRHRRPLLLELVHALNSPDKKIILLAGPQGIGKTSLARALIEPMGGGTEQVLWFETNRHTDFEEISHFLLRTIQELFETPANNDVALSFERRLDGERQRERSSGNSPVAGKDPLISQLDKLLRTVLDVPLLLVLDNVETLVDQNLGFSSASFKEVLNFLLGFPNIKMVLSGERLPYADIVPGQESVADIRLGGLEETDAVSWLQDSQRRNPPAKPDPGVLEQATLLAPPSDEHKRDAAIAEAKAIVVLVEKVHCNPWLLKTLLRINQATGLPFKILSALIGSHGEAGQFESDNASLHSTATEETVQRQYQPIVRSIVQLVEERLPDQQRALLYLLAFLRHPVNLPSLQAIAGSCYPALVQERLGEEALAAMLDHSLLLCLLKVSYPPQEVLAHVRRARERKQIGKTEIDGSTIKFKPGFELYQLAKTILHQRVILEERVRLHTLLRDLYLRERSREDHGRQLRMKNRSLLNEGRYHGDVVGSLSREGLSEAMRDEEPKPISTLNRKGPDALQPGPFRASPYSTAFAAPSLRDGLPFSAQLRGAYTDDFADDDLLSSDVSVFNDVQGKDRLGNTIEDSLFSGYSTGAEERSEPLTQTNNSSSLAYPVSSQKQNPLPGSENRTKEKAMYPAGNQKSSDRLSDIALEKAQKENLILWSAVRERLGDELGQWLKPPDRSAQVVAGEEEARDILLRQELQAALSQRDSVSLSKVLLDLSRLRGGRGQTADALRLLDIALTFKEMLPEGTLAELYQLMGSQQKTAYRHNASLQSLNRAASLIKKLMMMDESPVHPNRLWQERLGRIFQDLAEIHAFRGQLLPALSAAKESLQWYETAGEDALAAEIHLQLAGLAEDTKKITEAIAHYEKAIIWNASHGKPLAAATALSNLGHLHSDRRHFSEAEQCFLESIRYDRTGGNTDGELETFSNLVALYLQQGLWGKAQRSAQQGLAIAIKNGKTFWQANCYVKLGEIAEELQDWDEAHRHYRRAKSCGHAELSNESIHWLTQKIREMDKKRTKS